MVLKDLIGLKVKKAYEDNGNILLETSDGIISLIPFGDCCAICYITDIDNSEALQNSTIKEVEDLIRPELSESEKTNWSSEVWGHRIHTTKGIVTIGMRVDHNGYYGGILCVIKNKDGLDLTSFEELKDFT